MKQLIIILFTLISFAHAQEKDSSNRMYSPARGLMFREVISKPAYLDNDSIWYFEDGAGKWQVDGLTSKIITTQQAGIIADSATDQTASLNRLFSRARTKGVILSNDHSGSVIWITGEVDFKNKPVTADGSVRFDGPGKVKNLNVSGPAYSTIISPSVQIENVTSNINYFSATWIGIVTDSATNNKIASRRLQQIHRQNLVFPAGRGFVSDSSIYIPADNIIDMSACPLIANHSLHHALRIGDSANSYRTIWTKQIYNIRVRHRYMFPTITSETRAVLLINLENMEQINISDVNGFWRAVEVQGNNAGFVSCNIKLGQIFNCVEDIWLNNMYNGWVNAVTVDGGHLRNDGGFSVPGNPIRTGVRIGNRLYPNIASSNVIKGQTIELNSTTARSVYIENGGNNIIKDQYSEGNGPNFATIAPLTGNGGNVIRPLYLFAGTGGFKDSSRYGLNYYCPAGEDAIERAYNTPLLNIPDMSRVFFPYRGNGTSGAIGGRLTVLQACCLAKQTDTIINATTKDGYLRLYGYGSGIASPIFNSSVIKNFYVKVDRLSTEAGMVQFRFFKANGLLLDTAGNRPTINATLTWNSPYGGAWETTGSPENIFIIGVPDSASYFQVVLNGASSTTYTSIRSFQVGALGRVNPNIITASSEYTKVMQEPTAGTYRVGDIVYKVGDTSYFVATKSGTIYYTAPAAANATWSNNSPRVKLNVPVTTYEVNTFIQLGGAKHFIVAKNTSDSTLILENAMNGGGSGSVVIPAFDFIEVGGSGSAGGGGSGTVTSVGLSMPSIFSVSGSPVISSGTLTAALASQSANYFFAGPNGSSGTPSFRAMVSADIPSLTSAKISDFASNVRTNISLTTTGTSGAATYNNSTGVLNIPQYAPATHTHTMSNVTDLPQLSNNEVDAASTSVAGTNVASVDMVRYKYIRQGNIVMVVGRAQVTMTAAATYTAFYVSLPVASVLAGTYDVIGGGVYRTTGTEGTAVIIPNIPDGRARVDFTPTGVHTTANVYFNFSYVIR